MSDWHWWANSGIPIVVSYLLGHWQGRHWHDHPRTKRQKAGQ